MTGLPTDLTSAEIEVVEYDEPWYEAHSAFARRNWPTKFRRRDPGYQRWKFRGPAVGPVPGLLLAVARGHVLGQFGLLPGQLWLDGEVVPLQWICDLMTDKDARRLGISTTLFEVGVARPGVTLGPEPSPAASKALEAMGMSRFWTGHHLVLTLAAGPAVAGREPRLARFQRLISFAGAPVVGYVNRHLAAGARSSVAEVCRWTDVVDLVAADEATLTDPHAVHDCAFLEWRAAGLDGWVREVDALRTPSGSYVLVERDAHRLRVLQWHAVDADDAAAIFGRLLYLAGAYGVDQVQLYAVADQLPLLTPLGFRPRRTQVEIMSWPYERVDTGSFQFCGYDTDFGL